MPSSDSVVKPDGLLHVAEKTRIVVRIRNANRLAVVHDPACDAPFQWDDNSAARGFIHIGGNLEIQLPGGIVIQQNGSGFRAAYLGRSMHNA